MIGKTRVAALLAAAALISPSCSPGFAQTNSAPNEVGIVYYVGGGSAKPLDKEPVAQGGRSHYVARVRGDHAVLRLRTDQPQVFRVCGVDPGRFKLYRLKVQKNARTVTIANNNMWIGGSKVVLTDSEVPVAIQTSDSGCFTLTPRITLAEGEFTFSPLESLDAFTFGVGDLPPSK